MWEVLSEWRIGQLVRIIFLANRFCNYELRWVQQVARAGAYYAEWRHNFPKRASRSLLTTHYMEHPETELYYMWMMEDSPLNSPCMCLHIMETQKMSETPTSHGVVTYTRITETGHWNLVAIHVHSSDPWYLRGINTTSLLCTNCAKWRTMPPKPN